MDPYTGPMDSSGQSAGDRAGESGAVPAGAECGGVVLRVEGLSKHYGTFAAVAGLNWTVRGGSVVGMVGPNGAGKTTTMRAICGIVPTSAGRIEVSGVPLASDPVGAKRRLAYVPDDPPLFDTLTVWEHLRFAAAAYGVKGWEARGEELLRRFEMSGHREKLAQELSRGMRQKTAICAAYLHRPDLVLLDEPLTGLDPRGIRTMKDSIRELASGGAGVVVSSHLLSLVEDLCTDLLVMHKGRVLYDGAVGGVRAALGRGEGQASLEDVFLAATSDGDEA